MSRSAPSLRLRACIVTHLLSPPSSSASPISSLHRLLSANPRRISPNPSFSVEEYLVDTCGLSRPQALKAYTKLSHLRSPSKPNAVLAFLAGFGLSSADVAAVVAKDPHFLCAHVEKTLVSNAAGLTGLGLSRYEIARLISLAPSKFRLRSIASKLQYYLPLFGSIENFLLSVNRTSYLLGCDLERTIKPKVAFLHECGLGASDIAKLCVPAPRILITKIDRLRAMVACVEHLGVPRGSAMFRRALQVVACHREEKIKAKMEHLKNIFGWSDAEVGIAVCKEPKVLTGSKDKMQRVSEFIISKVGLKPGDIAHLPAFLNLSIEGRLRPRHYVLKFLKENGLLEHDRSYYSAVMVTNNDFVKKYICPHKEAAPCLAGDYDAACRGDVPINFRFT